MSDARLTLKTPWVERWQPQFIGTLLFLCRGDEVLLIHKKTGHGAGRVNGPGGKLEPGETVVAGACREVYEEVGLRVRNPRMAAEMRFVERRGPQWLGFALVSSDFSGQLRETPEAKPFWCPMEDIPYPLMWPDDRLWLPFVLSRPAQAAPFVINLLFDDETLVAHDFAACDSIWEAIVGPPKRVNCLKG
ncbi:MAG: 8-oxo-dGTP diphosphatase [Gammaproteobacteria bacterium]|jgi:8-oxo-dGTP diphosphatase|nr:8-oxo-dGTP diphosphatase [Gammaproteobacteria bacterium]